MRIHKLYTYVKYLCVSYYACIYLFSYLFFKFFVCSSPMNNVFKFDIEWKINANGKRATNEKTTPQKNNTNIKITWIGQYYIPKNGHTHSKFRYVDVLQFIRMKIIIDHKVDIFTIMECWWWATVRFKYVIFVTDTK